LVVVDVDVVVVVAIIDRIDREKSKRPKELPVNRASKNVRPSPSRPTVALSRRRSSIGALYPPTGSS
jgi:hypothetical protein